MRSEAVGRRQPELSTLWATASAEGADRAAVRQQVTELMQHLVAVLDELAAAHPGVVATREVAPLSVSTWQPWDEQGEQLPARHQVKGRVRVDLGDVEALAELTTRWSALEGVTLQAPVWSLTDDGRRELEAEVTREAVQQARERAQVMAEASGFSRVIPVQVADAGLLGEGERPSQPAMAGGLAVSRSMADGEESYEISPREVVVRVRVEARFRAE